MQCKRDLSVRAIVLATATVVAGISAQAATVTWDGGTGGTGTSWNDPLNWAGDVKPGSADWASIDKAGIVANKVLSLGASQTITRLSFNSWVNMTHTVGDANDVANGNTLTLINVYRGTDNSTNSQTIAANVILGGDSSWNLESSNSSGILIVGGNISGAGLSLTKTGGGTLEFRGANSYGNTIVNGGTINLNFNAGNSPAANILNTGSSLTLAGGSIAISGKNAANATNSQTINGVLINAGASGLSIVNGINSGKTAVDVGALTRNVGGTVNFSQPTANTAISASNGYVTSTGNDAGGILGGYATVGGANWASNNGTNIVALSTYTTDTWAAGSNTNLTADATVTDGSATHSLRFNNAAPRTVTLAGTAMVDSGGILVTSTVAANATSIVGGTLTSGTADLVVHQHNNNASGAMTISSTIADNGANSIGLTKAGAGNLILSSSQTYSGGTYVNAGTLTVTAGSTNQLSTAGKIVVSGGTLALGAGTSQSTSGDIVIRGGSITGGTLTKTSGNYDGQEGTVSSVLAGSGGLLKTGDGTLALTGANTYTGDTTVVEGTLTANQTNSIKGNLIVGSAAGGSTATYKTVKSGTTDTTPFSSSKKITVYGNGAVYFGAAAQYTAGGVDIVGGSINGGSQWYNQSTVNMTGGTMGGSVYGNDSLTIRVLTNPTPATVSAGIQRSYTFEVADGEGLIDLAFTGTVSGGKTLTKTGGGLMRATGSSSYTGSTTLNAGIFWVSGVGSINSTSAINVNNAAVFKYDSSVALTKLPTLNGTSTFIYNSPAKLGGDITIASGRTLGGSGTFANVTINGLLSPGNSPGQMTADSLVLGATSATTMEIGGEVLGSQYDNVSIVNSGGLTYGGTLDVIPYAGYSIDQGGSYTLFTFSGGYAGEFAAVNVGGLALTNDGGVWTGTQGASSYVFSDSTGVLAVAVPEPGTIGLVVSVFCMGLARRQRKTA